MQCHVLSTTPCAAEALLSLPLHSRRLTAQVFNLCRIAYIVDERVAFSQMMLDVLAAVPEQDALAFWAEAAKLQDAFLYHEATPENLRSTPPPTFEDGCQAWRVTLSCQADALPPPPPN